jgi:hypothetical protein
MEIDPFLFLHFYPGTMVIVTIAATARQNRTFGTLCHFTHQWNFITDPDDWIKASLKLLAWSRCIQKEQLYFVLDRQVLGALGFIHSRRYPEIFDRSFLLGTCPAERGCTTLIRLYIFFFQSLAGYRWRLQSRHWKSRSEKGCFTASLVSDMQAWWLR